MSLNPLSWWRALQRRLDVHMLWPTCLEQCHGDRHCATQAFLLHMAMDKAYEDLDEAARYEFVRSLPGGWLP